MRNPDYASGYVTINILLFHGIQLPKTSVYILLNLPFSFDEQTFAVRPASLWEKRVIFSFAQRNLACPFIQVPEIIFPCA